MENEDLSMMILKTRPKAPHILPAYVFCETVYLLGSLVVSTLYFQACVTTRERAKYFNGAAPLNSRQDANAPDPAAIFHLPWTDA